MRAAEIHRDPARADVGDAGEGVTHGPCAAIVIPALHPALARERIVRDIRGGEIGIENERIRRAAAAGLDEEAGGRRRGWRGGRAGNFPDAVRDFLRAEIKTSAEVLDDDGVHDVGLDSVGRAVAEIKRSAVRARSPIISTAIGRAGTHVVSAVLIGGHADERKGAIDVNDAQRAGRCHGIRIRE